MVEGHERARWYVVQTKPRSEAQAEEHLRRQSFETYLPWLTHAKRRRGRWTQVTDPLFPGYLFLRADPETQDLSTVRSTRGVVGLVRFGGGPPTPVPDALIDALRAMEDPEAGVHRADGSGLKTGDEVVVLDGALAGLRGIYQAASGEERAIILAEMLGKLSRIQVDVHLIEKAP